jgi:ribosomal protein S27AE
VIFDFEGVMPLLGLPSMLPLDLGQVFSMNQTFLDRSILSRSTDFEQSGISISIDHKCHRCGHDKAIAFPQDPHIRQECSRCGKWQKWMGKDLYAQLLEVQGGQG